MIYDTLSNSLTSKTAFDLLGIIKPSNEGVFFDLMFAINFEKKDSERFS
jgi:hypothetical protein